MSARIYDFENYKEFVLRFLEESPKKGRGQFTRMAEVAHTHKATISQIFNGENHLTPEQAVRIAEYLGLRPKEVQFFVLLVNLGRSGSESLRQIYQTQVSAERENNQQLSTRLQSERVLGNEEQAIFYTNWIYSAVRVVSSIDSFQTSDSIARRLNLPSEVVGKVIEFLLEVGLCIEKDGKIEPGAKSTYIEANSPLVPRHHGNWRVKAMERHPVLKSRTELSYTAPMSLAAADVIKVREILIGAIELTDKVVIPSACEKAFCLNIDWFEVR